MYQIHYLHGSYRVECARRLVGKQNLGFVHERAGYCDALALSARELIGLFAVQPRKPYAVERIVRALDPLRFANARNGERKLDVFRNGLVRDQVVALKNKAYAVIAVRIPIAVVVVFCADVVYLPLAVGVVV